MNTKKNEVMERIDAELADNPQLRRRVEEILTEIGARRPPQRNLSHSWGPRPPPRARPRITLGGSF